MDETTTDSALIQASIAEPERFGELFDRHYREIHNFAWRRLGSEHADDVAAEVFVRAFKERAKFDFDFGGARPWLYGIASNLIRMHARGEKRRLRAYARSAEDPAEEFTVGADDRASAEGARPELMRGLARLSAREREVVLMHAWGDLNSKEIGVALGLPDATVRTRLARARKKLAAGLDDESVGPEVATVPLPIEGAER